MVAVTPRADEGEQRSEEVGLVDRRRVLQHHRPALESGPGIDVLLGQGRLAAVLEALELHEDQVPDLEPAILVVRGALVGCGGVGVHVVMQLGAGAAGAILPGVPVVPLVGSVAKYAVFRQTHIVPPDRVGVVVVREDGDGEPIGRHAHHLGGELPSPGDRLPLEVVADRKVAQHLEHCQMRGVADLIDVGRAEALLHGGEPGVGRLRLAQEVGLEWNHAGAREEEGGIAWRDQRSTCHGLVSLVDEEVRECSPDLAGMHRLSRKLPRSRGKRQRREGSDFAPRPA